MKNILIAINSLVGGGAERVLKDILDNIDETKYNIDIFLLNKEGVYLEEIEKKYSVMFLNKERNMDVNVIFRKMQTQYIRSNIKLMTGKFGANRLLEDKYDIEIAFLEGPCTKLIANRDNKAKKIAWVHVDLEKHRTLPMKVEKKAYEKFDKIIAVSKDSARSVSKLYPMYKDKVEVMYNPIDVEKVRTMAKSEEMNYPKDCVNLVTVGRLEYQKGYDILLKAHKELMEEGYKYNLHMVGEGNKEKELRDFIKNNNLEESVHLHGFQRNPYKYIYNADAFVMSSRYEGLPLVIGETLSLGTPIVSTNCTGPSELLENGKYGILAECENIQSLKDAIKEIVSSSEKREKYGKLALERSKIFNINRTMQEVESLLDNI